MVESCGQIFVQHIIRIFLLFGKLKCFFVRCVPAQTPRPPDGKIGVWDESESSSGSKQQSSEFRQSCKVAKGLLPGILLVPT